MAETSAPAHLLVIDIDGLRNDVFQTALSEGLVPNLSRLAGGLSLGAVSTAPSITFCAQTTIFTGAQPDRHGIPGNQFFDRFGASSGSTPRFYAFDIGDTLAVDDAVLVFSGEGLINRLLDPSLPTLYERAAQHGCNSVVSHHMIARGAEWLRPSLIDIARFTKGGDRFGLSAAEYDRKMVERIFDYLERHPLPDVLTAYFMGVDHESHAHGPGAQPGYLARTVDPLVGRLLVRLEQDGWLADALVCVVSDHGQVQVQDDDRHSQRISFPFDREMGYLFDALGLDVHDLPGEDPDTDAVVASNGGMAHVYLQNKRGRWNDYPVFAETVLPVARAFLDANQTGRYASDLQDALAMILVRSAEADGWDADYSVYTPDRLLPVEEYLRLHPEIQTLQAAQRLAHLAGPMSGDLLLVSNYAGGFYFGAPTVGTHGGLAPGDSSAVFALGRPGAAAPEQDALRAAVREHLGEQSASLASVTPLLCRIMGW